MFQRKEGQLAKGLVFNHLKTAVPSLTVEFENEHQLSVKLDRTNSEEAPSYCREYKNIPKYRKKG